MGEEDPIPEELTGRLALQDLLEELLESDNVYFQPPSSLSMKYPCIVYELSHIKSDFADNNPYTLGVRYSVTIIDRDPDSTIPATIALLPLCSFDRFFTADNLNHYVFNIYF
jgi:hypothetical protein